MAGESDILGSTASMAATGATVGSVLPGPGTLVGAGIGAAVGLVGGIFSSKSAKKQQAAADAKTNQALAELTKRDQAMQALIADADKTSQESIARMVKAYAEIEQIQAQALADGKTDLAQQYETMKGMVDTNLQVEMAAIGKNYSELKQNLDEFGKVARGYVESDIESQKKLREQFDTDTEKVIPAIKQAMDRTEQRIGEIQSRGGLSPEADAVLSKTQEGLKEAKVKFEQNEALNRGSAGRASRKAGFDIAAVKALADVNASLRQQGTQEVQALSQQQVQTAERLQAAGANRQAAMQDTSGAQRLALASGLYEGEQQITGARQAQELGATKEAMGKKLELTSDRGAAELGMEQAYAKDRAALLETKAGSENALVQQGLANKMQMEGERTRIASSFADVLRGAASGLQQQASQSLANAGQGFSLAGLMAVRGADAWSSGRKTDVSQTKTAQVPNANGAGAMVLTDGGVPKISAANLFKM